MARLAQWLSFVTDGLKVTGSNPTQVLSILYFLTYAIFVYTFLLTLITPSPPFSPHPLSELWSLLPIPPTLYPTLSPLTLYTIDYIGVVNRQVL